MAPSADRIEDDDRRQYHIGVAPGEVAPWVLLVGDPTRADRVAEQFESVRLERNQREYVTRTGTWNRLEVTVMGTGIGCDNTEIALVELLHCVEKPTLIRVGSCGALNQDVDLGTVVISTGAVRLENTSLAFCEPGYPAIAHHEAILALKSSASDLGIPHRVGLTATASGFYGWQGRLGHALKPKDPGLLDRLRDQNVMNFEMESSTLFTLSQLAGIRSGTVCGVYANRAKGEFATQEQKALAEGRAIEVGLHALSWLAQMDKIASANGFALPRMDDT